jgi:hypothetical protein
MMAVTPREVSPGASERWELRIGATVYATDEVLGKLRQVVVSPGEQKVVGLVVRGGLPPEEYLIPIDAIQQADEEQIQLSWSLEAGEARFGASRVPTDGAEGPGDSEAARKGAERQRRGPDAGADVARLRQLTSDLQQIGYSLASAGADQQASVGSQSAPGAQGAGATDDDVIDAEFRPGQ